MAVDVLMATPNAPIARNRHCRTSKSRATGSRTGEPRNAASATGGNSKTADMSNKMAAITGCSAAVALANTYRSNNNVIVAIEMFAAAAWGLANYAELLVKHSITFRG